MTLCYSILPKQENYQLARPLALENLRQADLRARAAGSGGAYRRGPEGNERIESRYLGQELSLNFPGGTILAASGSPVFLREEIFLLDLCRMALGEMPFSSRPWKAA